MSSSNSVVLVGEFAGELSDIPAGTRFVLAVQKLNGRVDNIPVVGPHLPPGRYAIEGRLERVAFDGDDWVERTLHVVAERILALDAIKDFG